MKKVILSIISIILLNSCSNSDHIDTEKKLKLETLYSSTKVNGEGELSLGELETMLQKFKDKNNNPLEFTYVNILDNQYVITDMGYPSVSRYNFDYFVKKEEDSLIINKIIAKTETYAIFNNFIVDNINKGLTNRFVEIGHSISSQVSDKYVDEKIGAVNDLPMQMSMGKIANVNFFIRYDNDDEVLNLSPKYIIQCADNKITLKNDTIFFLGYDYNNLEQEAFAVLKNNLDKYTYYYDMDKLCSSID